MLLFHVYFALDTKSEGDAVISIGNKFTLALVLVNGC